MKVCVISIFINDLPNYISKCKISLYADDTVIICAGKTAEEVQISLQHDLNCALEWFKTNYLHLNVKKTKWSLISKYQKLRKATELNITVNGEQLERVDEYKYLGTIFDKHLNRHNHIDKMCAKISQRPGLLKRIMFCLPNVTLRMQYNTLVLPLFDDDNIIYRTTGQTYLKWLPIQQNKGACMLLNYNYRTYILDMLNELNWMTIKE